MTLVTDILKRSGLAPLSPRAKTQIHKRRRNALHPEIQARRKAVRACGFQNGKAVNLWVSLKHRNARLSLIGYLITGNRWGMMIFRRNRRDDNTSGDTNKPLLRQFLPVVSSSYCILNTHLEDSSWISLLKQ